MQDHQEFAWKVHVPFKVSKACNWAKKVNTYHVQLLAHPSIGKHHFLLLRDARFSTQDIHLAQLQHTITYARALQHWAKEVHPPVPSQPHHLARSVQELWWAMEPLVTFTEEDVFITIAPSKWTEITLPWPMEAVPQQSWKSCTQSGRVCLRGSLSVTHSEGKAGLLLLPCGPLQRQKHQQLHPRGLCHTRLHLTPSPCAHCQVLGDCPDPEVGRTHGECPTASQYWHPIKRGHRPLQSQGDGCDGDLATLTPNHWRRKC